MVVLVNRSFITEAQEFQADSRTVIESSQSSASETIRGGRSTEQTYNERSDRVTVADEQRVANFADLSEREQMQLQAAFMRPLRAAGVRLVDSEAATRLQQLSDSERRQFPERQRHENVETQAFINSADWLIELQATRSPDPARPHSLMARVIDLDSGAVLTTLTSDELTRPLQIPGRPGPPPTIPLEFSAEALAEGLLAELPAAVR
jgi:hypothetical protein